MSNRQSLLDAALALAASGIAVFPCNANKQPVCAGGHNRASSDLATVRQLFSTSLAKTIGMPAGVKTGIIVVDIDPRHEGDVWLEANAANIPVTRRHRTMSGGTHLLFKDGSHGIRNSQGKADGRKTGVAPGIDVRGNGGYVIIPPSAGYSVTDGSPIADMPEWLVEACRKANAQDDTAPRPARAPSAAIENGTPYGLAALSKACENIRSAMDGTKHEVINREAYSIGGLVSGGELIESDAFRALNDALHDMHARSPCKDFRAAEKTIARSFNEGKGRPRDVPELIAAPVDLSNIADYMASIRDPGEVIKRAATAKPLSVPTGIMDVDGALKMFVDYCDDTAISPQPFLALAAGIAAIGALAGRKYRTKTNLRTNVYTIGVADSGGGKEHARGRIKDVFEAAGLKRFGGGEDIKSGSGLMTALWRHPCMLFQIDEFGDWLNDVIGPKAASHKKEIAQRLKTLYSSAGTFVAGAEYADQSKIGKPREDIQQPNACVYGTTTPGQFWRAIADASMEDGFLARFLIFVSPDSYPDRRKPTYSQPPHDLIAAFKQIADGPDDGNLAGVMVAGVAFDPLIVEMTPDAEVVDEAMWNYQLDRQRTHTGTQQRAITARLAENATKLALIRAVSRDSISPRIMGADMAWGRLLAEHCIDTLLREADENIADSPFARNMQAALKIIRKHGPITEYQMVRNGWKANEKERAEILRTLTGTGQIGAPVVDAVKAGRPTQRYIHTG